MSDFKLPDIAPQSRRPTMGPRSRSSEAVVMDVNQMLVAKHVADEQSTQEEAEKREIARAEKEKKKKLREAKKARAAKMKELMDNGQDAAKAKKKRIQEAKKKHG